MYIINLLAKITLTTLRKGIVVIANRYGLYWYILTFVKVCFTYLLTHSLTHSPNSVNKSTYSLSDKVGRLVTLSASTNCHTNGTETSNLSLQSTPPCANQFIHLRWRPSRWTYRACAEWSWVSEWCRSYIGGRVIRFRPIDCIRVFRNNTTRQLRNECVIRRQSTESRRIVRGRLSNTSSGTSLRCSIVNNQWAGIVFTQTIWSSAVDAHCTHACPSHGTVTPSPSTVTAPAARHGPSLRTLCILTRLRENRTKVRGATERVEHKALSERESYTGRPSGRQHSSTMRVVSIILVRIYTDACMRAYTDRRRQNCKLVRVQ